MGKEEKEKEKSEKKMLSSSPSASASPYLYIYLFNSSFSSRHLIRQVKTLLRVSNLPYIFTSLSTIKSLHKRAQDLPASSVMECRFWYLFIGETCLNGRHLVTSIFFTSP